jgi:hypothetical protein
MSDKEFEFNEIDNYLLEKNININDMNDVRKWWFIHKDQYKKLYELSKIYTIIPGASIEDERENSELGNIITKKRCSIKAETVSNLTFLNNNIDLF